jgi:hypothetical protein
VLAALAAALAGSKPEVVESNFIYRLIVFGITFAIAYVVVAIFWYAWQRKTLQKLGVGPASGEAPSQEAEVTKRDQEVQAFMETTTDAVENLEQRLQEQEQREDA